MRRNVKFIALVSVVLFVGLSAGRVSAQRVVITPRNAGSTVTTARRVYAPRITSVRAQPQFGATQLRQMSEQDIISNRTNAILRQRGVTSIDANDWVAQSNYWSANDQARREVLGQRYTKPSGGTRAASIIANIFGGLQLFSPAIQTYGNRRPRR